MRARVGRKAHRCNGVNPNESTALSNAASSADETAARPIVCLPSSLAIFSIAASSAGEAAARGIGWPPMPLAVATWGSVDGFMRRIA
jgi:hypothetical protein